MDNRKIKINPVSAVLIFFQVIFIILMIISFRNLFDSSEPKLDIEVSGLRDEIAGLSEEGKEVIEYNIYQAVSLNSISDNIQKSGVFIREGSLINEYFEKINVHYVNFIADIPDIQQSYKVVYEWSDNPENEFISPDYSAVAMCLDESQLIYGDFDCVNEKSYVKNAIVSDMIRGNEYIIPGHEDIGISFISSVRYDDFKIQINYLDCGSQCVCREVSDAEKQEAVGLFVDFLSKLGFVKEEIPFYFYNCG